MRVTPLLWLPLCAGIWACTGSVTDPEPADGGSVAVDPTQGATTDATIVAESPDAQVNDAGVQPGAPGPRDAASADSGTLGEAASGALTLRLFNVVRGESLPGSLPLPSVLERVELPPRVTVSAQADADIAAVRFFIDGVETRLDTSAPFLLSEASDGKPSAWTLAAGKHRIEARAYGDVSAQGSPRATVSWELDYRRTGLPATFTALSDTANKDWVSANLDGVMVEKSFAGSMGTLPYRLFTPKEYDASVRYPLLVYLHGRGQRGSDNSPAIYRSSQLFTGPRSIVSPNLQNDYPAIVVVPQCNDQPDSEEWARWTGSLTADGAYTQAPSPSPSMLHVSELVAKLRTELSVDERRIYVTGESMGGFGTWEATTRWPDVWAAGVPMAGYSDRSKVARIVETPFWIFHGSADEYNPVAGSRAMKAALEAAGGDVRYTEYAGLKHIPTFQRAWTEEPELLAWIFAQYKQ